MPGNVGLQDLTLFTSFSILCKKSDPNLLNEYAQLLDSPEDHDTLKNNISVPNDELTPEQLQFVLNQLPQPEASHDMEMER